MNLPDILNLEQILLSEASINELLQVNEETRANGLVLTAEEARQIIKTRNRVLKSYGRIELSFEASKKLITALSASTFVTEENYIRIISDMQETFYYLKNETEDRLGDDYLIGIMIDLFENSCEGSVELLNSCLEAFSRDFRSNLG